MKKHWYDYLWIVSLTYLILGFFNILFAWLGLLCFFIPLIISIAKGTKGYCNRYCGRGQLFELLRRLVFKCAERILTQRIHRYRRHLRIQKTRRLHASAQRARINASHCRIGELLLQGKQLAYPLFAKIKICLSNIFSFQIGLCQSMTDQIDMVRTHR